MEDFKKSDFNYVEYLNIWLSLSNLYIRDLINVLAMADNLVNSEIITDDQYREFLHSAADKLHYLANEYGEWI